MSGAETIIIIGGGNARKNGIPDNGPYESDYGFEISNLSGATVFFTYTNTSNVSDDFGLMDGQGSLRGPGTLIVNW